MKRSTPRVAAVALPIVTVALAALMVTGYFATVSDLLALPHWRMIDLSVYRGGAEAVVHGASLYSGEFYRHLAFTYPPFAALAFVPLTVTGVAFNTLASLPLNAVLLVFAVWRMSVLADRELRPAHVLGLAVLALSTDPVRTAFTLGQVDILVAALVIGDLSLPDDSRYKGALIGLAAAVKLTPLIFVAFLLWSGRFRAGARAIAAFVATIIVSFIFVPGDATAFWVHGTALHASRAGAVGSSVNQSLLALLDRISGTNETLLALPLDLIILMCGLWSARRLDRDGQPLLAFVITGATGLLISPISWFHHWTLLVPAIPFLLWSGNATAVRAGALGFLAIALVFPLLSPLFGQSAPQQLLVDLYVEAGLAMVAAATWCQLRSRSAAPL